LAENITPGANKGTPLAGGGVVFRRAADEFVMAIRFADEPGGAESREGGGLKPEGDDWEMVALF
jgi:hypothetical protein